MHINKEEHLGQVNDMQYCASFALTQIYSCSMSLPSRFFRNSLITCARRCTGVEMRFTPFQFFRLYFIGMEPNSFKFVLVKKLYVLKSVELFDVL